MTNKIIKRSLGIIILSSTFVFYGAYQAGEAKIDTLKITSVTESVAPEMKFKFIKLPVVEIKPVEIEPVEIKPDTYQIAEITAFTSGFESTQKKKGQKGYGITASGKKVRENHTIACPKSMSFGTEVYIKELNHTYVCEDRGNRITEGHIDVYFDDLKVAKAFGRKKMSIKIID